MPVSGYHLSCEVLIVLKVLQLYLKLLGWVSLVVGDDESLRRDWLYMSILLYVVYQKHRVWLVESVVWVYGSS